MPNPAGTYTCDIQSNHTDDLHYSGNGMRVCDIFYDGSMPQIGASDLHEMVRKAEDESWQQGYAQGMSQGQGGEVIRKLLHYLEKSDDDEVGLLLAELKAGASK